MLHLVWMKIDLQMKLCAWHYIIFTHTGAVAFGSAHFGAGAGPIHLDDVGCSGSESRLTDCQSNVFVNCYSGHSEDAGVRCQGA